MIEANENIDLVTLRRQQDLASSRQAARESRATTAPQTAEASMDVAVGQPLAAAAAIVPETPPPADDARAAGTFTPTRLVIAATLVVLLLVIWIVQKKSASHS